MFNEVQNLFWTQKVLHESFFVTPYRKLVAQNRILGEESIFSSKITYPFSKKEEILKEKLSFGSFFYGLYPIESSLQPAQYSRKRGFEAGN